MSGHLGAAAAKAQATAGSHRRRMQDPLVAEAAAVAVRAALVKLVLGKDATAAFFASLALLLRLEQNPALRTAATDGHRLIYSPDYVVGLSRDALVGLIAHEVMHCALGHMSRRGARDPRRWNIACDLVINQILVEAGYTLPDGALMPGQGPYRYLPTGLSAEEYYALLPEDPADGQGGGPGNGNAEDLGEDPGGCGAVRDAGDDAQSAESAAAWEIAVAQAAQVARQRGELPAGIGRLVTAITEPAVPWQDVLREFVSRALAARDDYSWSRPNRRYIAQGLYLPSLRSESLGEIVIAIDTSGSIGPSTLAMFVGELNGILECAPCRAHIVYCDAAVHRVDEWEPVDGPLTITDAPGGGGTSHVPVWDWLAQADIDAACVVCLTDGHTDYGSAPAVPVLWALTQPGRPPFGRVVEIRS